MFGLLGKKLSHSYSKEIHEYFTGKEYTLFESDDLKEFFSTTPFTGLNITIPYKHDVVSYCDQLSTEAEAIGVINTIVRQRGQLTGYNTDYYGLEKMLQFSGISVKDKHILILGNGSTSRTIQYYCEQNLAKKITVLARNPKHNEYYFSSVDNFETATIVFNATPVGMFPNNNDHLPVHLNQLPNAVSVIDVIYNPLRSNLFIEAEKRGLKAVNGLMMLIMQAVKAIELFHNLTISDQDALNYYHKLHSTMSNIVLIGMPMSGKTFFAKLIAERYNKTVVEIDEAIEQDTGLSIPDLFHKEGEEGFRYHEKRLIQKYSKQHNQAISCGGGVVLNEVNILHLRQNGVIVFIDMPLSMLERCNPKDRPLLQNKENIRRLYYDRHELYKKYADIIVPKRTYDETVTMRLIEVKLNEYFSS